jgi:hypothetical protein
MSAQPEVWRVSTIEGVFETDLETLKQWIVEGCVLPTDKVTKGNQSWIEAGRVPHLKGAFDGDAGTAPKPATPSFESFVASTPDFNNSPQLNSTAPAPWVETSTVAVPPSSPGTDHQQHTTPTTDWTEPENFSAPATSVCENHPDAAPEYVCRMCGAVFCKDCPKKVGRVAVCPSCGDLCREYRAVTEKAARVEMQSSGFGMEDFVRAVRYPLQHQVALLVGASIYGALLFAGFRGSLLAWVFLFGCMSHTISQVAWGRLNRSFMPDFSAFSWWDDVIMPVFLSVGIIIVSWGPVVVLVFALFFGAVSGRVNSALPGGGQAAESSGPDVSVLTDPEADGAKLAEESAKLDGLRPGAVVARETEQAQAEAADPTGSVRDLWRLLAGGTAGDVLLLLFFAWGLFYHPMAFAVAGYTQSFGSVLNPLVGLDAIRRMRGTYFKAFAMVILVYIVSLLVNGVISIFTAPLALPFMGNIVGNYITALFAFYFNLVVACVLGLALFKCADRLGIGVD